MTLPILLFALFYAVGIQEGAVRFSSGAFAQPYSGGNSLASIILGAIALCHLVLYHLYLLPAFLNDEKMHLAAISSSEMTAIFGFIIGFLNLNPWAALPYFAVSLANFAYAFFKIQGRSP